jgi:hypothetical protein
VLRVVDDLRDGQSLVGIPRAEPAHARVELHVHAARDSQRVRAGCERVSELRLPGDHVGGRLDGEPGILVRERSHDEQRRVDRVPAQLRGLACCGDGQPVGAARKGGLRAPRVAVAVRVCLHDGAEPGVRADLLADPGAVALDGAKVDVRQGALDHPGLRKPAGSASITSPATTWSGPYF